MNKERDRDLKPLQRNASYLWSSSLTNTSTESTVLSLLPSLSLSILSILYALLLPIWPSLFSSASSPSAADSLNPKLSMVRSSRCVRLLTPPPRPPPHAGVLSSSMFTCDRTATIWVLSQLVVQDVRTGTTSYYISRVSPFILVWLQ